MTAIDMQSMKEKAKTGGAVKYGLAFAIAAFFLGTAIANAVVAYETLSEDWSAWNEWIRLVAIVLLPLGAYDLYQSLTKKPAS